jgi:hypothetical protein
MQILNGTNWLLSNVQNCRHECLRMSDPGRKATSVLFSMTCDDERRYRCSAFSKHFKSCRPTVHCLSEEGIRGALCGLADEAGIAGVTRGLRA